MSNPSPHFNLKVGGEDREVFMSFGLLDDLARLVGDPGNVAQVHVDFELRQDFLGMLLAKRKKSGKIQSQVDMDDVEVDIEEIEELLSWGIDHVLAFFIRSLKKVAAVTKKNEAEIKDLVSTFPGLSDLASKTASSGPQAPDPAP